MTLIIAALAPEYVVVGADRRLSSRGAIVDEESTKLTVLATPDVRAVLAYTGIATAGQFRTEQWLLDTLHQHANKGTRNVHGLLEALRSEAGRALRGVGTDLLERRLTLLVAGFLYEASGTESRAWRITNWEHTPTRCVTPDFQTISHVAPGQGSLVLTAGNAIGVDMDSIQALLERRPPPEGVESKIHDAIRKCSRDPRSQNSVGPQCNTCIVQQDSDKPIDATYYSDHVTHRMYGVNAVFTHAGVMVSSGVRLEVPAWAPPVTVPKRRPNEPCSCGSGIKYKKCHGALEFPYGSAFMRSACEKPPYPPSGKAVVVCSRGAAGR